jgi:regulator of protease activity HflC (stomatin/prohibitin superfamily)
VTESGVIVATSEIDIHRFSGYRALLVILGAGASGVAVWVAGASDAEHDGLSGALVTLGVVLLVGALISLRGLVVVAPNEAKVATLLGRYRGTLRVPGFHWINPCTGRETISLRVRNLDSDTLKVNDAAGNPVEIAAVINWQVADTAMATFDVQSYLDFVGIQAETAVRHVASEYPYDAYEPGQRSLRANADDVAATLQAELQDRLRVAGVAVLDTRLRRLAYAPEIAGEMLRRQQAAAVVAARQLIVEGALGMVSGALREMESAQLVELTPEQRAHLVSNLLVVLVSDRGTQPVVNAGA